MSFSLGNMEIHVSSPVAFHTQESNNSCFVSQPGNLLLKFMCYFIQVFNMEMCCFTRFLG